MPYESNCDLIRDHDDFEPQSVGIETSMPQL